MTLAAAMCSTAFPAGAADTQAVLLDGERQSVAAFNRDGRLYVPAVFLREAGASVGWNEAAQAVVLHRGSTSVSLTAASGVIHKPEGSYVPLRRTAESLGMRVSYDAATHSAVIVAGGTSGTAGAAADAEDLRWLERITEAESGGEPYEGKVAVAASILNRVDHADWPNTIQGVIFQIVEVQGVKYYQYSPVLDGRIYEAEPSEETKRAVRAALDGDDPTGGATVFYNPDKTDNVWVRERPVSTTIGGHVFAY
ncbi:cell wall hydrolase [Paenibacillus sp.]|uniref:cell wall hydrolase n=1 Tax=Paenibacillus sp. TaxID=58172 RepID=UPI002D7120FD|nr:cell wall hydrolase [Paenibacillus sp.]HZG57710.1 cell wall hydrolase [Paenibacillus sp.]